MLFSPPPPGTVYQIWTTTIPAAGAFDTQNTARALPRKTRGIRAFRLTNPANPFAIHVPEWNGLILVENYVKVASESDPWNPITLDFRDGDRKPTILRFIGSAPADFFVHLVICLPGVC